MRTWAQLFPSLEGQNMLVSFDFPGRFNGEEYIRESENCFMVIIVFSGEEGSMGSEAEMQIYF